MDFCLVRGIVLECRELVNWWWMFIGMFGVVLCVFILFMIWLVELGFRSLEMIVKYVIVIIIIGNINIV